MRISDWSSDVCSSDLRADLRTLTQRRPDRAIEFKSIGGTRYVMLSLNGRYNFLVCCQREGLRPTPLKRRPDQPHKSLKIVARLRVNQLKSCLVIVEIGRASCRERVCRYV